MEGAATNSARRALLAVSLMASVVAATATGEVVTIEWLKITAVPLLVFLVGACIWGCIQNYSTVWRVLSELDGGGIMSARTYEAGEVVVSANSSRPNDNMHRDAPVDVEAGLELPQVCTGIDDDVDSRSTNAADAQMDGRVAQAIVSDIGDAPGC